MSFSSKGLVTICRYKMVDDYLPGLYLQARCVRLGWYLAIVEKTCPRCGQYGQHLLTETYTR